MKANHNASAGPQKSKQMKEALCQEQA